MDGRLFDTHRQMLNGKHMEPSLLARNLSYSYGDIKAIDDISFHVDPGEILGFLGPNGAGKSTTIKILSGQLEPDSGYASILGRPMSLDDPELQSRIGVCFEEKNLYANMTGRENLVFFAKLFGMRDLDVDALLGKVGLEGRGSHRVSSYSKGMKQRLMVARAIINKPDVLFLDEPTDGLDPVSSRTLRGVIREQAERGAAILLTTHDMWEADELSHRVAFINRGELYTVDTPENLKLSHGSRSARIRLKSGDGVREEKIQLDDGNAWERMGELASSRDLISIHTEEATLEDIFVSITGSELEV